ncbi:MAG: response regulator transcription factor [Bacteroidia bacterium]|nr:response regulator transcription factor [Bacteroidia bacterium]
MSTILLVEDEPNFGAVLRDYLQMNGHVATLVRDGAEGWDAFRAGTFDLCILDVMMPKVDGFALAKRIREADPAQPIMFLTARHQQMDKNEGLRIGADDYLTKPFDSEELLLRISAILKRSQGRQARTAPQEDLYFASFHFSPKVHSLSSAAGEERLSPKESELLELLLAHKNDLLSREFALQQLWGDDNYFNARSMDVFISKLRKRLKSDDRVKIDNIHGKGFSLLVEGE